MISPFPTLQTRRLLFRKFNERDIGNVFKGLSHPDVIQYYGVRYDSLEATKAQMQFFSDLEANESGIWWAICSLDNSVFYGAGGVNGVVKAHRKGEIGFWLLPEFWGQGYMTEAVPVICDYAFRKLDLHRIEGIVESKNTACKKALAKLEFRHEGTMADCEIKDGTFISLDIYAKLNGK